ncbi:MAG: tryptophan-rich sensory protein [Ardenticatenales bacterium]|nr:tryptophan-rich sensory protein [Ardenticatenales bacterium]
MNKKLLSPARLVAANILAYVAVLVVNILSNALPLNGRTAAEVSDALPSYFTPAGYTFSIWGLIYLALAGFVIYQALPAQRDQLFQRQIGGLFVLSSFLNAGWLFAWHYGQFALSLLLMASLLVTLIAIYLRLRNGLHHQARSLSRRLLVHVPFSLYLGWITVATIANIASVVAYWGWDGFGIAGPTWSAIMMSVAVVVAGLLLYQRRDFAYAGVLVWALFGIRSAFPNIAIIANTAVVAAVLIAALAILGAWRSRQPTATRLGSQPA